MTCDNTVAFDVGNTRIKCAIVEGEDVSVKFSVRTHPVDTLMSRLRQTQNNPSQKVPTDLKAVVSSVCPPANDPLRTFWNATTTAPIIFLGDRLPIPVSRRMSDPATTGTDRLLCALAVREQHGSPCISIMAGSAITVDLVDSNGEFAGGAIAPGYTLCARALEDGTASLPHVDLNSRGEVVGRDTTEAINSGINHFCRGGVRSLVKDFARQLKTPPPVVVTGGDAPRLLPLAIDLTVEHKPMLIFDGIRAVLMTRDW